MAKQNLNNSKGWKSSSYVYSPISALLTVCMSFFFPFVPCWGKVKRKVAQIMGSTFSGFSFARVCGG